MTTGELMDSVKSRPLLTICVVVSLGLGAALYFRTDTIPAAETILEQKSTEGRRLALNLRNATQLNEQLAAVVSSLEQIEPRLIRSDELAKNLQYFYKLEAETGVKLLELRQTSGTAGARDRGKDSFGSFVPVAFTLSVQGDYKTLLGWLKRLETGVHYCRVTSATIGVNAVDRSGQLTLQLTLELLGRS